MHLTKYLFATIVFLATGLTLCSCSGYRSLAKAPSDATVFAPGTHGDFSDNGDFGRLLASTTLNNSNAMAPNFATGNVTSKPFCIVKDPSAVATFSFSSATDHPSCEVLGLGSAITATDRLFLQEASSSAAGNDRIAVTYVFSKISPGAASRPESGGREIFSSPEMEFSFRCVAAVGTPVSFQQISAIFNNQVQFVVVGM